MNPGLAGPDDARPESPDEAAFDPRVTLAQPGRLLRPTVIVTICALGAHLLAAGTQVVTAAFFGAGAEMDAYLAATTLPQYVTAVLAGSLTFVCIPLFVERAGKGLKSEWSLVGGLIEVAVLVLALLAAIGVIFSGPLIQLVAPGLSPESAALAARASVLIWPSILAQAVVALITGIHQAQSSFSWPAIVPLFGSAVNLLVLIVGAPRFGIYAAAAAMSLGVVVQMLLLAPILLRNVAWGEVRPWRNPDVRHALGLLMPILFSGVIVRCAPVLERFLASELRPGSISHLGYAFRIVGMLNILLATGLATVVFPRMAKSAGQRNLGEMAATASLAARFMFLGIAPAILLVGVLAEPLTAVLFRHGEFTQADVLRVAPLVRIYVLSLLPSALGAITGRMFYALKATRIIGIAAVLEVSAYAAAASWLSRQFDAAGVAAAYALYFNGSLLWQVIVLRRKTVPRGGGRIARSAVRTTVAAAGAGLAAWFVSGAVGGSYAQLLLGGAAGALVYVAGLMALRSPEAAEFFYLVKSRVQVRPSR